LGARQQAARHHQPAVPVRTQVYGFSCRCPRCLLEASPAWQQQQAEGGSDGGDSSGWETDSGAGGEQQAGDAASGGSDTAMHVDDDSAADDGAAAAGERLDPAYLSLFVLKYVCPADGCGGTMAALRAAHGQQAQQGEVLECSVCGALRSEAEFLAELEA
jgi:SET and MYND domain-containing protein